MQYRELSRQRGCRFVDDAWTLDMAHVRGLNLLYALGIEHVNENDAPLTAEEREGRANLEKCFFKIIGTPFFYSRRVSELRLTISKYTHVERWPRHEIQNVTVDNVVRRLAAAGIPETVIDDAFLFAQSWVLDVTAPLPNGWTAADVAEILQYSKGYTQLPIPLFERGIDYCMRSPFLPWMHEAENVIQYEMHNWCPPELAGMQREHNSRILKAIQNGRAKPGRDTGLIARYNPFIKLRNNLPPSYIRSKFNPSGPCTATLAPGAVGLLSALTPSTSRAARVQLAPVSTAPSAISGSSSASELEASIYAPANSNTHFQTLLTNANFFEPTSAPVERTHGYREHSGHDVRNGTERYTMFFTANVGTEAQPVLCQLELNIGNLCFWTIFVPNTILHVQDMSQ
ncbi:hypothetical protein MVEN_00090100 [Mycena venus]|uniref:Uncharacterized protein n=1 Tax=Mycena venus TaxID=2733690 RepID=A0A8H6Z493_9AGAR|nr:hypothetical protein MVEN_00090100 [Mycena venus]